MAWPSRCSMVTMPFISTIISQTTHTFKPNRWESASSLIWECAHTRTHRQKWVMAASLAAVILTLQKEETVAVESSPDQTVSQMYYYANEQSLWWRKRGWIEFSVMTLECTGTCYTLDTVNTLHQLRRDTLQLRHSYKIAASFLTCCKAADDFL